VDSWVERWSSTSSRNKSTVRRLLLDHCSPVADGIVVPLAFTRAGVDMAYTKLDLMDQEAVEGFFQNHDVESGFL
jgi:hypothetical protein